MMSGSHPHSAAYFILVARITCPLRNGFTELLLYCTGMSDTEEPAEFRFDSTHP